jgi:hypothetical protein
MKMSAKLAQQQRPQSLFEVAERTIDGQPFDPILREFLDEFYNHAELRESMLATEPSNVGALEDAYLAAVAEHLAEYWRLRCPPWVNGRHRFLHSPFFAGGLENLKATLLVESPIAFRRRMIFVGANVLNRPRQVNAG